MAWEDLPESTRSRLEDLFDYSRRPLGTIDSPTIDGLLVLAGEGPDIWNAWAESNPDFHIDFSRHNFTEPTNFSGFIFPPGPSGKTSFKGSSFQKSVNFSGCRFPQKVSFESTKFQDEANFRGCNFAGNAGFYKCEFTGHAAFDGSKFSENAQFVEVIFTNDASFEGSTFLKGINLRSIKINGNVNFTCCQFFHQFSFGSSGGHGAIDFSDSRFFGTSNFTSLKSLSNAEFKETHFHGDMTFWKNEIASSNFSESVFLSDAKFIRNTFQQEAFFSKCKFEGYTSFSGSAFPSSADFGLSAFKKNLNFSCYSSEIEPKDARELKVISFSGCQFHGTARFDNRNFTSKSSFAKNGEGKTASATVFHKAPTFHGCKFHQDTSFHGAKFIQDYGEEAAKAYRTLKLAFEQLKSTREEQRFFKHEMQAERPDLTGWKWLFSWVYGFCSDYGFSIWRPLATLLALSVAIGAAHGVIANAIADASWKEALTPKPENVGSERTLTTAQYVLINTIPAPGIDKTQQKLREDLFETETSPTPLSAIALFLEFIHKFIALLCVFLSGLAVRNLLKMKS